MKTNPFAGQEPVEYRSQTSSKSEVPTTLAPIPSKGLVYPPTSPLHDLKEVPLKAITAEEEIILESKALFQNGTVLHKLAESLVVDKHLPLGDLLIGDFNAIMYTIRIHNFGAEYKAKSVCELCNKQSENVFRLDGLELRGVGEEAHQIAPYQNLFEFITPTGRIIHFSLLTTSEDEEIQTIQEKREKATRRQGRVLEVDHSGLDRLLKAVKGIDGERDPAKVAQKVRSLLVQDTRALKKHINNIQPTLLNKQDVECLHCKEVSAHWIPMTLSFFWPSED